MGNFSEFSLFFEIMGSSKSEEKTKAESTVAVIEKAGAKVAKNYDNLINDYQPALQNLIDSAREIDTILYSYSSAQDKFNQSMKSVLRACNNSIGNDEEIIDALTESDKLNKSLQGEYYDFSQVYATDMIKPFEDRMAQDTKFLEDQLRNFKTKFGENIKILNERYKQLEKLNKNRGKSKKEDKKRMDLEIEITQRTEALEQYSKDKLRESIVETRKRYLFLSKKQASHVAKMKLLYEQCGNHVAEYYPNIIGNYDEKLPHQSEHAVDNLFPGKRVSVYHKAEDLPRVASPRSNSPFSSMDGDIPPKPIVQPPIGKGKKMVKTTHGFHGSDSTQLRIEPGDYIQLMIPQPRDGWHYGENERTGLKGWFPIKYTVKV